ncbi:MAG: ImmA/IrrE family metallo-endopeptidase [Pseudomonadota bacterium]
MTKKFRLDAATRHGEQIAKRYGFEQFPVEPAKIAAAEEIHIEAKPPVQKGVSGGIIFSGENVGIFYATDIDHEGFQRFTIGHELGHYFLEGHPEALQEIAPIHLSRAGFSQGKDFIELEADHFSAGLLMPSRLVKKELDRHPVGLDGILALSERAKCSVTAAAIRAAQCSPYPLAIIVSQGDDICYGFLSVGFKSLGRLRNYPRKGDTLPPGATRTFNSDLDNVIKARRTCSETSFSDWFDGDKVILLDEEVMGLGSYGFTLSVFSNDMLPEDPDNEDEDDEDSLIESWTPRFARGR